MDAKLICMLTEDFFEHRKKGVTYGQYIISRLYNMPEFKEKISYIVNDVNIQRTLLSDNITDFRTALSKYVKY